MKMTVQRHLLAFSACLVVMFPLVGCDKKDAMPSSDSSELAASVSNAQAAPADLVSSERPPDEAAFIAAVSHAQETQSSAQNDMQRGGIKADRDAAICKLLASGNIQGWTGRVNKVDANSDGKGVFKVEIAPDIFLQTWNNDLSDFADHTLMEPNSQVFKAASNMAKGAAVRVSGTLFAGDSGDCVKEGSLTLRGKLQEPEFIFKFDAISVLSASPAPQAATGTVHAVEQTAVPIPASPPLVADNDPHASDAQPALVEPRSGQEDDVKQPAVDVASVSEQGPSFDCRKATSRVERLICNTPELSAVDANMAMAYQAALRQSRDKDALRGFQNDWLKYNRDRCSDVECLRRSYRERLNNLQDAQ